MVTLAPTGKVVRVVDAQRQVPRQVVENVVSNIAQTLTVPVLASTLECRGESLTDMVKKGMEMPKTGVLVALVSDKSAPALLVAPEAGWATVNVSALADDLPPADVLGVRVQKEIWRGLAMTLGAANSQMQPCLMSNVTSLESLDQNKMMVPSPEPIMKMFQGVKARGILPGRRATYRRACEQGWAPAPTNDVQRAIFEQVKADKERGPTNPLKITPPNAKK